jgi:hypothetical protein
MLVVEWRGRRPYSVDRRDGDWLQLLIRASPQLEPLEWLLAAKPDRQPGAERNAP